MVCSGPEDLVFFSKKEVVAIRDFRPKGASTRKKMLLDTEDGRFFIKFVGHDIGKNVAEIYLKIRQDNCLKHYFPNLVAYEKGWLIYEYVEGREFLPFFIRKLVSIKFQKVLPIFFLLGKCLALYHNSFVKDCVRAKDYLKPYLLELNEYHSHDDLLKKIPIVKTYNDFTMRNILMTKQKKFLCLDIDAAFHPKFPRYMLSYHDISIFSLNVLSLSKIPFLPYSRIKKAIYEFLNGYFCNYQHIKYSKYLLQTFIKFHYCGLLMDRSIDDIYSGMQNIIFRRKIATAIKTNKFNFLPSAVGACQ